MSHLFSRQRAGRRFASGLLALCMAMLLCAACVLPGRTEVAYANGDTGAQPPPAAQGEAVSPGNPGEGPRTSPVAPSEGAAAPQPRQAPPPVQRTLGVGDVLDIRVFQEADLTGTYRISEEGRIDFPFCGRIDVAGMTQGALTDRITDCLKNGYLKNPQVTVFLKEFNSQKVFVLGQVNKPGTFPFEENMTVVQAVSLAGGFGKLASKNSVIVTRRTPSGEQKFKVPVENIAEGRHANFTLQPGDIVYVPESFL